MHQPKAKAGEKQGHYMQPSVLPKNTESSALSIKRLGQLTSALMYLVPVT